MRKKKNTILVIDNEPQTCKILNITMGAPEYEIVECSLGKQAMRLCVSMRPDIILLDLNIPDMKGDDIIRGIREWSKTPIIIITSRDADEDVIYCFDIGADDYVIKPFNADVLRVRIISAIRKSAIEETGESELCNGPLKINLVRHEIFLGDELIAFTPKEYNLLRYFITHRGKMLGHREILREIWGTSHSEDVQYLRVFVRQIREKIEKNPAKPMIITTELGIGYRMELLDQPRSPLQGEFHV